MSVNWLSFLRCLLFKNLIQSWVLSLQRGSTRPSFDLEDVDIPSPTYFCILLVNQYTSGATATMHRLPPSTSRGPGQTQEFVESRERGKHPWTSKKRRNICEVTCESDKLRKEILCLDLTEFEPKQILNQLDIDLVGLFLFLSCMRYSELTYPGRREYCIIFGRYKKHGLMKGYADKEKQCKQQAEETLHDTRRVIVAFKIFPRLQKLEQLFRKDETNFIFDKGRHCGNKG
ncbi:hypothetical protein VNO77_38935 [Canavalia gladiata]|uniref:Uncharacterized protein n=1 Tax=Canavalia gladiata TaxID=3824 RepID=A0AAN9KA49_CANGL